MKGKSYITPSFQNSVILGTYFMKHYEIVFDASSSSGSNIIYLYDAKRVDPSSNNNWMFFVVGGIFLVLICCCCANNRRKTVNNGVTAVLVNTTTQAPLIINQQGVYPNTFGGYVNNGSQQPQVVYPTYNTGYQQPQGGLYVPADNGYSGGYPQSQPPS